MEAKGLNGQLEFTGDRVVIKRKGLLGLVSHGFTGDKEILLSSISSVQLRKPTLIANGFIQFTFHGSADVSSGMDDIVKDENSIILKKRHYAAFEAIRDAILKAVDASKSPTKPSSSIADELAKLAALKGAGHISQQEFDTQKAKLFDQNL